MTTETIRPSSNITTTWNGYGYTKINDAVTQPTSPSDIARPIVPSTSSFAIGTNKQDDGEEDQYGFTAPATSGTMTGVVLWIFGEVYKISPGDPSPGFTFRVRLNGSWTSYLSYSGNTTPWDGSPENPNWSSYSWTVSGAALGSAPAFGCKTPSSLANGQGIYIYCAYLVITTTGGGSTNRKRRSLLTRFANMG